jgi:hypoxia-inducible factor (prolyl hydroxylase)
MFPRFIVGSVRCSDVEPRNNRLVLFWSDTRVPHEVLPAHADRYCVTVWFFDKLERLQAERDAEA